MKSRYRLILCCISFWFAPLVANANSASELIEQFPQGQINWTRGVIIAKGVSEFQAADNSEPTGPASRPAFDQAVHNVMEILQKLRVDDKRCAAHLLSANKKMRAQIEMMARSSTVIQTEKTPTGGEAVTVQMSLYGGFAQLMLPVDIRQVQPIKPLNRALPRHYSKNSAARSSETYTGLIIDARGTGARPSMVPRLVDEKGYEVFGPAYISREFAVQHGICQYIRMTNGEWTKSPRVGSHPLVVKGLRTAIPKSCDIVISNADASKLRGTSTHLDFLKKCRVMIVLDE